MKIGKLVKLDENSWAIKSNDDVYKIDPHHSFWLKIWGEEGDEFGFEIHGDFARIRRVDAHYSNPHPVF